MATYYGTFSCGHDGKVTVFGDKKLRDFMADKKFEDICEECKQKEREKENQKALEKSKEYDFPELFGTEKQEFSFISQDAVRPKNIEFDGFVEILNNNGRIVLKYEKNDVFKYIVKSYGFSWDSDDGWCRTLMIVCQVNYNTKIPLSSYTLPCFCILFQMHH